MNIRLIVHPGQRSVSWTEFEASTGPFSIALDGYVSDGPRYDDIAPRINFDHHSGVERLATHATCGQVLMAIRSHLFDRFRDENGPCADIYVNDPDEDVCASVFLLRNEELVRSAVNPRLNRLIGLVDLMDSTAGAYPFPSDLPGLEELAWIFQPYRDFRRSGGLERKIAAEFETIIAEVGRRFLLAIEGRGQSLPLDVRYERIGGGPGWDMIHEIGESGRMGAFANGTKAYVVARERVDGRWSYTIGRVSQFVRFDVPKILTAFGWGGGNTIGGSPRIEGCPWSPKDVEDRINAVLGL